MTAHLLQIAVGPVQEFIAQARRTRDLWYGSHLLSEVSRAVARSLHQDPRVVLIFPAFGRSEAGEQSSDPRLEACVTPFHPKGHPDAGKAPANVANIILAKVEGATAEEMPHIATAARERLGGFLRNRIAAKIEEDCRPLLAEGIGDVWNEQVETFIEFAAAWTPIAQGSEGYGAARNRLIKGIAARKNLRDFEPWKHHREGTPKSSLDGARVSVLKEPSNRPAKLVRKWRLGEAEQLDAIGLIKRAGGDDPADRPKEDRHDLQFVPIFNVALAPWMRLARETDADAFKRAMDAAAEAGVSMVRRNIPAGRPLCNRDAAIFLPSRWWPEFREQGLLEERARKNDGSVDHHEWRREIQTWGKRHIGPLLELVGEPHPYVTCLAADGDGMGAAIEKLGSAEEHRAFSRELAEFARAAREIVEEARQQPDGTVKCHLGSLVYSGGDDVLAFLPVSTALACADELRTKFTEIMARALGRDTGLPTLSVGIGIGHVMESMADLLDLGRRAEKQAKGGSLPDKSVRRNALAVIVDKRSGGTREWRAQWSAEPVKRLAKDGKLLAGTDEELPGMRLPFRKVYQIKDIVRRLPDPWPGTGDALAGFERVLRAEVERTLRRIDGGGGKLEPEDVGLGIEGMADYAVMRGVVLEWINRMLIARAFAESEPRSKRGSGAPAAEAAT